MLYAIPAAAIAAVGGYALVERAPWRDYDGQSNGIRKTMVTLPGIPTQAQEIVRYATLAASSHNTQPWRFVIGPNAIELHPDYGRRLPVVDPNDRELWISLGCALENLLIASSAAGYSSIVTYPDEIDFIRVTLSADKHHLGTLFDAIPLRQNTRSKYDGKSIQTTQLETLHRMSLEPGVRVRFVLSSSEIKLISEYVDRGNRIQYSDQAFVNELTHWLRFNNKEAFASLDGLYSRCSGKPQVPRWLGKLFVTGTNADIANLFSSAGVAVITSAADGKSSWVRTGQVYERMALTMTSLNIKSAFLNQPIEAVALRQQLQSALGLGELRPQLLFRFGHAPSLPPSLRRPIQQVLEPTVS